MCIECSQVLVEAAPSLPAAGSLRSPAMGTVSFTGLGTGRVTFGHAATGASPAMRTTPMAQVGVPTFPSSSIHSPVAQFTVQQLNSKPSTRSSVHSPVAQFTVQQLNSKPNTRSSVHSPVAQLTAKWVNSQPSGCACVTPPQIVFGYETAHWDG
jgi:hypothetical protein